MVLGYFLVIPWIVPRQFAFYQDPIDKCPIIDSKPLDFIRPIMFRVHPLPFYPLDTVDHYGLDKVGGIFLGNFSWILPVNRVTPRVFRFRVSHIAKSYFLITEQLDLTFVFSIVTTLPDL